MTQRRDPGRHSCKDARGSAKVEEGGVFLRPYSRMLDKDTVLLHANSVGVGVGVGDEALT